MKQKSVFQKIISFFRPEKKLEEWVGKEDVIITSRQAVINNFKSNKLAMAGLVSFLTLLTFVLVGAFLNPVDFHANELELINIAPGRNILSFPKELNGNLQKLEVGTSFSMALDKQGKLYAWGIDVNGVLKIPEAVRTSRVEDFTVGDSFAIARLESGEFLGWGNNLGLQAEVPSGVISSLTGGNYKTLFAGKNFAGVVTKNGKAYLWGDQSNEQDIIKKVWQGNILKANAGKFNAILLLKDHTVAMTGKGYVSKNIPVELTNGSVKVVDVAISKNNAIALDDQGKVYTWGNSGSKLLLSENPEITDKIVAIRAGYNAYALLTDKGEVKMIGTDVYGEFKVPNVKFKEIYGAYFGFYGVDEQGNLHAWGNKGFLLGSDELGRDLLIRLFHGGRISLFVGIIAILISSFIGMLAGLLSGFLGGWVDMLIQRTGEIISSIPFLPLVMTLSFAIGNKMDAIQKMYLVMVLIGFLSWVGLSRLVRGQILIEREKDFVLAARALGLKESVIILKHILPSVLNIAIVSITLGYASTMLTESGLSFLGFGVQSPIPSWGNMLTSAQQASVVDLYWWRWVFPTAMIVIAVLSINLVGDGLREAMDPKSNEK